MSDLVAVWDIALSDGVHKVEFEHGTTTGKRVIRVDGEVGVTVSNWLCVCVCVCMYACMHACLRERACECTYACVCCIWCILIVPGDILGVLIVLSIVLGVY